MVARIMDMATATIRMRIPITATATTPATHTDTDLIGEARGGGIGGAGISPHPYVQLAPATRRVGGRDVPRPNTTSTDFFIFEGKLELGAVSLDFAIADN